MVKKIIAVATAILMLCCMVPLAAFADDVLVTCLNAVNARMRHGMIAQLQFPILVFLFLVKDGIALPVSILTMIGIAWVSLAIKILIAALAT